MQSEIWLCFWKKTNTLLYIYLKEKLIIPRIWREIGAFICCCHSKENAPQLSWWRTRPGRIDKTKSIKVSQLNETPLNVPLVAAGCSNIKLPVDTCRIHLFQNTSVSWKMLYLHDIPALFSSPPLCMSARQVILVSQQVRVFWEVTWRFRRFRQTRRSWCKGVDSLAVLCSAARCQISAVSPWGNMCMCISECVCVFLISFASLADRDRLQGWRSGAALQVLKGKVARRDCRTHQLG